jgi:hypothetical protein
MRDPGRFTDELSTVKAARQPAWQLPNAVMNMSKLAQLLRSCTSTLKLMMSKSSNPNSSLDKYLYRVTTRNCTTALTVELAGSSINLSSSTHYAVA